MLTKIIDGVEMVCLRPEYAFPAFDVSIQTKAFAATGEFVYGEPRPILVEPNGRQWFHPSLVAPELSEYLLTDLSRYQRILERRVQDYVKVRDLTTASASIVTSGATSQDRSALADAIEKLGDAYALSLRSVVIANLVVEDLYHRYASLIHAYLPSAEANRYLAATITCPAAREATRVGFCEDTRGTKRIQDVKSDPITIFATIEPYIPHYLDGQLCSRAVGGNLAHFWALRFIAPMTVQLCEEFRYADYSIRTNLKACLEEARRCLGLDQSPYEYAIEPMLAMLREHHL